jgi:DNA-binding LacI/PurR family transcriptional regulator
VTGGFDRSTGRPRGPGRPAHPTLDSVARAAGVSRQTVSNILNAPHKVNHATRARVEAEIERQGYRPNRSARSLRRRQTGLFGYCVQPPVANAVMDHFIHAVTAAAERHGYHILLFTEAADVQPSMAVYRSLLAQRAVDGFVISDTTVGDERQRWFTEHGVPFAAFGRRWEEPEVGPWVDVDGAAGSAAAVDHVVDLGHRRLAFVGWPEGSGVGDDRADGFGRACRAHGVRDDLIVRGENGLDTGHRLAAGLLALAEPPTAIVCVSDELALGCDLAVREAGLTPGRDVAITGFDDSPAVGLPGVAITSVRQPVDEAGERVVNLLIAALGDRDEPTDPVLLEPELVVRASTYHPDRRTDQQPETARSTRHA